MRRIQILIADDHELVRRGLRALLQTQRGWVVCAEAADGRQAVEKARQLKPHVAVVDFSMPELNGLEATRQIRSVSPRTEVLILTVHDSEQLVREVLVAGACGYVLKSDAGRDLVAGVQSVASGKPFFTTRVAQMVLNGFLKAAAASKSPRTAPSVLSPREREVVQLLAEGKTNKEAAAAMGISVKTVETHRNNLMQKLGLRSIGDLIRYAIRNKIVDG